MDDLFYCIECTKIADNPVKLNCHHTFCKDCATKLLDISYIMTFRKDIF